MFTRMHIYWRCLYQCLIWMCVCMHNLNPGYRPNSIDVQYMYVHTVHKYKINISFYRQVYIISYYCGAIQSYLLSICILNTKIRCIYTPLISFPTGKDTIQGIKYIQ